MYGDSNTKLFVEARYLDVLSPASINNPNGLGTTAVKADVPKSFRSRWACASSRCKSTSNPFCVNHAEGLDGGSAVTTNSSLRPASPLLHAQFRSRKVRAGEPAFAGMTFAPWMEQKVEKSHRRARCAPPAVRAGSAEATASSRSRPRLVPGLLVFPAHQL